MRIFFYMKGLEIATALLLVGFVLTTWSLCGKREKGDILHEHCPLIFDHVEDLNSPDAVDRFFDRLRSNATEAPTRNRAARSVAKTINGQKNAEAEADENAEFPDEVLETAEFDTKIGPIAYMVLKIQHTFGESMTCCDIGPRNIACFPSDPSSPMTCRKLSPIMIPVLLWITCALFNAAHIVKILSNPMPPNAISVIWLLSLITSVWDRCNSWSWLQYGHGRCMAMACGHGCCVTIAGFHSWPRAAVIGYNRNILGLLAGFCASLILRFTFLQRGKLNRATLALGIGLCMNIFIMVGSAEGASVGGTNLPIDIVRAVANVILWFSSSAVLSYMHLTWTNSWTEVPFSPYFPAHWVMAEVFSWMAVVSAVLQIRLHDKLYFNVQLKAPPHSFGDYKRTHELLPYATRN
ncbi:hypothetical protein L596_008120 [Steinernema carpocapsae]|uniref:Uncharacterized protein n=1 Tax=Steinernema carpocapsae TaxID=34508 RepID=A0A4U5PBR7_STECR|nr:hypothetical protein L596_008120 [Steinernema carpocapsae]